jgi:hypothetical protein
MGQREITSDCGFLISDLALRNQGNEKLDVFGTSLALLVNKLRQSSQRGELPQ